jgi:hypothetical protein
MAAVGKSAPTAKLTKAWFLQSLNDRFHVDDKGWQGVEMQLVAVQEGPQSRGLDQFSLVFRAPRDAQLQSGLYHVKHARDGWFQVYLDRGQGGSAGSSFHATFSLIA